MMNDRPKHLLTVHGYGCVLLAFSAVAAMSNIAGAANTDSEVDAPLEWVKVSAKGTGFELDPSGRAFVPWGLNYDHDEDGRLLEQYWADEWSKVEQDFAEMKALGANVVRIHLQVGRFLRAADEPDPAAFERLDRLVSLAERVGLYLDVTGLACYLKSEVPDWYDGLSESKRWAAQARFWEEIARLCANRRAIFCYDLMNEPVVPGGTRGRGEWLGPAFAGKYHFVQFVTLDARGRPRPEIARQWIRTLTTAIRKHDRRHLITVGLVPWSLDRPGLTSGFVPGRIAGELDFVSVHLYPESGTLAEAFETLQGFSVGKPVVIEEMFPLKCSPAELRTFIRQSRGTAHGWIGFYWGKTPDAYDPPATIAEAITLEWLKLFEQGPPHDAQ